MLKRHPGRKVKSLIFSVFLISYGFLWAPSFNVLVLIFLYLSFPFSNKIFCFKQPPWVRAL